MEGLVLHFCIRPVSRALVLLAIMDIRAQLAFLQLWPPRASQIFRLQLRRETLFHPGDFRLANLGWKLSGIR